jgi:hypothetical protein
LIVAQNEFTVMATTTTTASTRTLALDGTNHKEVQGESQASFKIPWPESKDAQRRWQLEQMAGAFRIFSKLGFADGGSGHISLRGKCILRRTHTLIASVPDISKTQSTRTRSGSIHMACTSAS